MRRTSKLLSGRFNDFMTMEPHYKTQIRKRTKGFTLLETAIAITILGASAAVFSAYIPTAMQTGSMVGNYQQASMLAQHKIDEVRSLGYGRLTPKELALAGVIEESGEALSPENLKSEDESDEEKSKDSGKEKSLGDDGSPKYTLPKGKLKSRTIKIKSASLTVSDYSPDIRRVIVRLAWDGTSSSPGDGQLAAIALIAKE